MSAQIKVDFVTQGQLPLYVPMRCKSILESTVSISSKFPVTFSISEIYNKTKHFLFQEMLKKQKTYLFLLLLPCRVQKAFALPFILLFHVAAASSTAVNLWHRQTSVNTLFAISNTFFTIPVQHSAKNTTLTRHIQKFSSLHLRNLLHDSHVILVASLYFKNSQVQWCKNSQATSLKVKTGYSRVHKHNTIHDCDCTENMLSQMHDPQVNK